MNAKQKRIKAAARMSAKLPDYLKLSEADQAAAREIPTANVVYEMISTSRFENWYAGRFTTHFQGSIDPAEKNAIVCELARMLTEAQTVLKHNIR